MKLLIDQGFGRECAAILRGKGHDAVHVAEMDRHRDSDTELVVYAIRQGQVIVTLDADFHAIVALSGLASPSVIRVRIEGLKSPAAAELIHLEVVRSADALSRGALVSVYEGRTGMPILPIHG